MLFTREISRLPFPFFFTLIAVYKVYFYFPKALLLIMYKETFCRQSLKLPIYTILMPTFLMHENTIVLSFQ